MIEQIIRWKAPDGTIHETEAEAYQHINKETAKEKLIDLIAENFNWEDSDIAPKDFASFILDHAKYINDLLEEWRGV